MGLRGIALGVAAATAIGCVAGFAIDSNVKLKDENKQLVVEVENANTKYDKANALLEEARAEMTSLNLTLTEKQAVIDANGITIADLTSAKEQLQTQLNTVTTERDNLQTELDAEKEKYNNLVAEHTELTNTYNALVESNNLTLEQKAELETQLADKQTEIENKNAQINELTTAINAKDAEIATLTENYNNAVIQIEALQAENASLITERDNLQAQVTSLRSDIEQATRNINDFTISLNDFFFEIYVQGQKKSTSEQINMFVKGKENEYYHSTMSGADIAYWLIDSEFTKHFNVNKNFVYTLTGPGVQTDFYSTTSIYGGEFDCELVATLNGGELTLDGFNTGIMHDIWTKIEFEFDENQNLIFTKFYIDIRTET